MKNKIVLITGAGQGMGLACAQKFLESGANVIINDIDSQRLDQVKKKLKDFDGCYKTIAKDISSKLEVESMVQDAIDIYGQLNILINCAGVLKTTQVIDIPENEWDFIMSVNLKGTFLCSQAVLPHMREARWGRIINFSSTAGKYISTIGGAHYTASKAGILGFTRHLAKEEASYGITVNSICPGLINTEMVSKTISKKKIDDYKKSFPIQRLGEPEEVADLVMYLSSNKSSYITGASFDINGGDLLI